MHACYLVAELYRVCAITTLFLLMTKTNATEVNLRFAKSSFICEGVNTNVIGSYHHTYLL